MSDQVLRANKQLKNYFLFGFLLNLVVFYPGFLSPDGIDQYGQSLTGRYDDWHPPVMAFVWSLLNNLNKTSGLMLAMQLSWFWYACYVLALSIDKRLWRILIIIFSFAPFVHNFSGYIIKDSQMAFAWLLAFALMFQAMISGVRLTRGRFIAVALLLIYGTWVRINALPGAVPLYAMFTCVLWPRKTWKSRVLPIIGLTILIPAGEIAFRKMLNPIKKHSEAKLFLHDISGISIKSNKNYYPAVLFENPRFDTAFIRAQYNTATFDNIFWDSNGEQIIKFNAAQSKALKDAWLNAISEHPLIYLHNRFDGFLYYLRIKKRSDFFCSSYHWMQANKLGLSYESNTVAGLIFEYVDIGKNMFYMRPWFWVLFNILLFPFIGFVKNRSYRHAYIILLLSSLLYFLPSFFVFQTDTDFRYFYWNCIACTIALFILVISKKQTGDKVKE